MVIYFVIRIHITTWSGGWMIKALGCGQRGESSNCIFNMLCFVVFVTFPWWLKFTKHKKKELFKSFFEYLNHNFNVTLDPSIIQYEKKLSLYLLFMAYHSWFFWVFSNFFLEGFCALPAYICVLARAIWAKTRSKKLGAPR